MVQACVDFISIVNTISFACVFAEADAEKDEAIEKLMEMMREKGLGGTLYEPKKEKQKFFEQF